MMNVSQMRTDNFLFNNPSPSTAKSEGGVGEINFGKQYRQGNRIYSSCKSAMCILSQSIGCAGGNSYMYLERISDESTQTDR